MGKKNKNKEKLKMPMEAEKEVGYQPETLPELPRHVVYEKLKECAMAFPNAIQGFFSRETEKETGKEEEEEEEEEGMVAAAEEGEQKKRKNKKKKKKSKKVEEYEMDESSNAIQSATSAEEDQDEYREELLKEMKTKYTEEKIDEIFEDCDNDPHLVALLVQKLNSQERVEQAKSKQTKKKEVPFAQHEQRINALESKSQFEVGSSNGVPKQGGSVHDDAGRTDPTYNDTVQGPHGADVNQSSQLDNVSSPPTAAVSSVASELPRLNIGKWKGKEIVRSIGDKTRVLSRGHVPPMRAVGPPRICARRAGSDPRASRNDAAGSSRNVLGKVFTALGSSSTPRDRGLRTYAEVLTPPVIPNRNACNPGSSGTLECEHLPTSSEPKIHADESNTQHEVASSSIVKQGGNCDDDAARTDAAPDDTVQGLQGKGKGEEVVESMDDKTAVLSRSDITTFHAVGSLRLHESSTGSDPRASENNVASSSRNDSGVRPTASGGSSTPHSSGEKWEIPHPHTFESLADSHNTNPGSSGTLERELLPTSTELFNAMTSNQQHGPLGLAEERELHAAESPLHDTPSVDPQFELPEISVSENAPPFTPSASIHQLPQTLLRGNNFLTGHGFTHPCIGASSYQHQLPLQYGYMNRGEHMHQNFGYDMTSSRQEEYLRSSASGANIYPSSWRSFMGRGTTPHQFLPYSPAPSDVSRTQLNSAFHVQAQHHHRNDYCPIRTNNNFAARNNQHYPGARSTLPEQQQGGLLRWLPRPSDRNNQQSYMPSAQQALYQGGNSFQEGYPSQQHPGTRIRPSTTGNFQDLSSMQPPRDLGPQG